jgi:UDP-N-acetylmuramate: L-alanyl-gamma-D-glutamyl-meso-diaminopimelate ligase
VEALADAPCVALKVPEPHDMVPADQRLDAEQVVSELRARGADARAEADVDRLVQLVADRHQPGDVVLVMSNGAFGGFIDRLLTALRRPADVA